MYAPSELFEFSAASTSQLLNMMESKITNTMELLATSDTEYSISNLDYYRTVLERQTQSIQNTISQFQGIAHPTKEILSEMDWPRAEEPSERKHVKVAAQKFLQDWQYLVDRSTKLSQQCQEAMGIVMNYPSIAESKKAILQGEKVGKLT
jgi:hypothetical protein